MRLPLLALTLATLVIGGVAVFACDDGASPREPSANDSGSPAVVDAGPNPDADITRIVALEPGRSRPAAEVCERDGGECGRDDDCGESVPCDCDRRFCLTASGCKTDGDCAAGQRCALSQPAGAALNRGDASALPVGFGFFCTTPDDNCNCLATFGDGYHPVPACGYFPSEGRWHCYFGP